jgi:hypothetical protein
VILVCVVVSSSFSFFFPSILVVYLQQALVIPLKGNLPFSIQFFFKD